MRPLQRHKGVIFDLDGTLADSRLDFARLRADLGLPPPTPILEALATPMPEAVEFYWQWHKT
jgi:phosphoglycolate phosphatase-like HAD superfamily hydrolase